MMRTTHDDLPMSHASTSRLYLPLPSDTRLRVYLGALDHDTCRVRRDELERVEEGVLLPVSLCGAISAREI